MSTGARGKAVGPDEVVGRSGDVKVVGNVDEEDDEEEEEEEWVEMGKHVVSCSVVTSEREIANAEANREEEGNVVSHEVVKGKAVGLDEEEDDDEVEDGWVAVVNEEEEAIVVSNEVLVACCS
jgi:hypothetical protein